MAETIPSVTSDVPMLPEGCGYMGYDFGARYIDSQCYGGRLYDLDNCDEPGTLNEPLEYIHCPECRHEDWLVEVLERCEEEGGIAKFDGLPRKPPYVKEQLRYPKDLRRMQNAWKRGWDSEEADT